MPNRQGHKVLTTACAITTLTTYYLLPTTYFLFLESGILITLLPEFTPDLDMSIRKFSALQEFIGLRSYARSIPHRYGTKKQHWQELQQPTGLRKRRPSVFDTKHWSRLRLWHIFFFSHVPFLGTLLRTMLLCLPLAVLAMLLWSYLGSTIREWLPLLPAYFLYLWLGMSWSDCWHVAADLIASDFKETKREFWYGKQKEQRKLFRKSKEA